MKLSIITVLGLLLLNIQVLGHCGTCGVGGKKHPHPKPERIKLSKELRLSVKQERDVQDILGTYHKKRNDLNQNTIEKLKSILNPKQVDRIVRNHIH